MTVRESLGTRPALCIDSSDFKRYWNRSQGELQPTGIS